jgi:hypothetical protein
VFDAICKADIEYAKTTGKDGVSIISDMDSFSYLKGGLVQYEMTLPKVFEGMDSKGMFGRLALESTMVCTFLLVGSPTPYTNEFVSVNLLLFTTFHTDK